MVRVIGSLVFGGLILLLASSNAHMVETRFGPLIMLAPHFVVLGITFFSWFRHWDCVGVCECYETAQA